MVDSDRLKRSKKEKKTKTSSEKSICSKIFDKILDKVPFLFIWLLILGIIVAMVLFPYVFVYISGGMPDPSGDRIVHNNTSKLYQFGDIIQFGTIEISATDAFTCREYDTVGKSIFFATVNYFPKEGYEFVFVGISAKSLVNNGSNNLPNIDEFFLVCDSNQTHGLLPTDGYPFNIPKFENRDKINFIPFAATPYGYSMIFKQNVTEIQSGYITFPKSTSIPLQECRLVFDPNEQNNTVIWSFSG
jgi:hypothetical protein